jgi:hypothetical protein
METILLILATPKPDATTALGFPPALLIELRSCDSDGKEWRAIGEHYSCERLAEIYAKARQRQLSLETPEQKVRIVYGSE